MKTWRFSDAQVMAILKQAEDGITVAQLCREHGMRLPATSSAVAGSQWSFTSQYAISSGLRGG